MLYITLPPFPKLIFMIVRLDCFKLYLKIDVVLLKHKNTRDDANS